MDPKKGLAASKSAASKFMSIVSDDLFHEILFRFPDVRSVMQCASVCKRWHSLIITPHSRNFILLFIQYHLRKQSLDCSYKSHILFNYSESNYGPYYQPCSEKLKHYDLSFMMNCGDLAKRAASDDLLLVSCDVRHYFICNSLTKECLALPEVPRLLYFGLECPTFDKEADGSFGFAIVRNPVCTDEDRYGYKVVIINFCHFDIGLHGNDAYCFDVAIFDLETGIWTLEGRYIPYPINDELSEEELDDAELIDEGEIDDEELFDEEEIDDEELIDEDEEEIDYEELNPPVYIGFEIAVDSNGVLHWLDGEDKLDAVFVFDPFSMKSSFVQFPCSQFNDLFPYKSRDRVRLGAVRGQVRLSLMEDDFRLKVWELISESKTWVLVYDFYFEKTSLGKGDMFFVLGFDPNDGNVVVMVRDEHIYRDEIEQDKYDKVCEFPYDGQSIEEKKERVAKYLKVLTPVQAFWPTWTLSRTLIF